ncbi:MAG: hypothetical protein C0629_06750 [Chromatiales bacterium]|jgi:LPS-assembly lipoprotein|nr:MAG: hypothetical protein C0629_06750 [Chromatiales bacterium]
MGVSACWQDVVVRVGLAVTSAAALHGCGYRLEAPDALPEVMETTYIESRNPYSVLSLTLDRRLRAAGINVTDRRNEASAILKLLRDETGQRLLSVSADNVPQEYEVYYTVSYQLSTEGEPRLEARPMTVTRDYSYDETDVLGKRREEEAIRAALAEDLVRLMMRRLASVE